MRNVSDKRCRENQNNFMFTNYFSENRATYEIKWKITIRARQATDDNII